MWVLLKKDYDGLAVISAGPYASHLHLAPESRQITAIAPHNSILQAGRPSCHPTAAAAAAAAAEVRRIRRPRCSALLLSFARFGLIYSQMAP